MLKKKYILLSTQMLWFSLTSVRLVHTFHISNCIHAVFMCVCEYFGVCDTFGSHLSLECYSGMCVHVCVCVCVCMCVRVRVCVDTQVYFHEHTFSLQTVLPESTPTENL